jgi:ParB family chromosome partitioning protein
LIKIAPWQPRKAFDEQALQELSESIKTYGVLQPIIVRKVGEFFEIVAGERRYRASKIANLLQIPVVVLEDDDQALEISVIENLQRQDLNPIEKAEAFAFLMQKLNITQEQLAKKLNLSRSYVANYLRMNSLDDNLKQKLVNKELSVGHAKILAGKKDAQKLAKDMLDKKLTVKQAAGVQKPSKESSAELQRFEEMLSNALNKAKVGINLDKESGQISISFSSLEELEQIISTICL